MNPSHTCHTEWQHISSEQALHTFSPGQHLLPQCALVKLLADCVPAKQPTVYRRTCVTVQNILRPMLSGTTQQRILLTFLHLLTSYLYTRI